MVVKNIQFHTTAVELKQHTLTTSTFSRRATRVLMITLNDSTYMFRRCSRAVQFRFHDDSWREWYGTFVRSSRQPP